MGIAASITVGPVAILCIQRTISKGRSSGVFSGIGVACADTVLAIIAFLFYSILQSQIEQHSTLLRVVGGIFVVIVGVYIFMQNPVPQIRRNRTGQKSPWQDFASVFGLTMANFIMVIPYILAFFAVFKISGVGDPGVALNNTARTVMVLAGFLSGALCWWIGLAWGIGSIRHKFRPRHMLTINRVAGSFIGILGAYTILSTFFDKFTYV